MKILEDFTEKIKVYKEELFIVFLIIVCTLTGFGLGRLSKISEQKTPITIELPSKINETNGFGANLSESETKFVASKKGTKYYFPWCEGIKKINPKNIVEFASKEEAESAGFTKAANCPGL